MMRVRSFLLLCLTASPLCAEEVWRVEPDFSKKKARKDISGAACGPNICYAVNDETHYIQRFDIKERRLIPGKRVDLLDHKAEIDAEAIAFANGTFYIAGSHGLSRKKATYKPSSFTVFRLNDGNVQSSTRLGEAIAKAPALDEYAQQPLNKNGANIEGLAAVNDTLFFGFRGPSIDGEAVILETSASALFSEDDLPVKIHTIPLGERIGIRDIAAVSEGLLLLTGPVNTLPRRYTVAFWEPQTDTVISLAAIPTADCGKPEGLLVLEEQSDHYRVLVLHDGQRNGAPTAFLVKKP